VFVHVIKASHAHHQHFIETTFFFAVTTKKKNTMKMYSEKEKKRKSEKKEQQSTSEFFFVLPVFDLDRDIESKKLFPTIPSSSSYHVVFSDSNFKLYEEKFVGRRE
jgi:hypothetical protein